MRSEVFLVSFYSFKGGVGRTLTLLNAAWHLAQRGSRVVLLDLDLEAPGLHNAKLKKEELGGWQAPKPRLGFSDLVRCFAERREISEWPGEYLVEGLGPEGRVALLAARGEESPSYETFVQGFSWPHFYRSMNGRGFMEGLVQGVADLGYDYLFVDARTGLTDVAGITLIQLPDLAVLVTNLSDQSVYGIRTQLLAIDEVNRESQAEDGEGRHRRLARRSARISVLLVGSPLPSGEFIARQARIEAVERILSRPLDIQVDYLPLLALEEENHILAQRLEARNSDELLLGAARPYERLAQEIVARNPAAPENLLAEGEELNQLGRWREALAHFDEVQDRYGERRDRVQWEALLHKTRAQLQALNASAAQESLERLERDQSPRRTWEDTAQIARTRLAASWTLVILNRFKEARKEADHATELLKEASVGRPEQQALLAASCFFLGQAHGFCDEWAAACDRLGAAARICGEMGTRPLLECLALAELARARLLKGELFAAREAIGRAWGRAGFADGSSVKDEAPHPNRSRIASTYVKARLLQVRAEVSCEEGKGPSAREDLGEAFKIFKDDGDQVALIEVAVFRAALDLVPPALDEQVTKPDVWEFWKTRADGLNMPRVAVRFELLRSARSLAAGLISNTDLSIPNGDFGPVIGALVSLERCRRILASGEVPTHALLGEAKRALSEAPSPQREVEHELKLIAALRETMEGLPADEAARALRGHAEELRHDGFRLREAQARVVLALGRADRTSLSELRQSVEELDQPKDWLWNLPVAFVEHVSELQSRWRSVEPSLRNYWPRSVVEGRKRPRYRRQA